MKKYWVELDTNRQIAIGNFDEEYSIPYDNISAKYRFCVEKVNSWEDVYDPSQKGIWKFSSILPICQSTVDDQCLFAGDELSSPIEIPEIASLLHVKKFFVFPCVNGLSGTFKDIEACFVMGKIKEWNYHGPISFHSTGNTARAYREYAIKNRFESMAFLPLSCVNKMIGASQDGQNKIALFNGPFQEISAYAKQWASRNGYLHIAPLLWKVEGKAPLGYHIMHSVPETTHIIQTVAGGYGILGISQAISRLIEWGICLNHPRFLLFQLSGADSFYHFFPLEKELCPSELKLHSNSFEPTLQSTNPLSTYGYVRHCCLKTNSLICPSDVSTILEYAVEFITLCEKYSIPISFTDEKSPFISYAGLRKYAKERGFNGDETLSFVLTGARERVGDIPNVEVIFQ